MKRALSISILSLFLICILGLALAWTQEQTERPQRRLQERRIEKMIKELDLTDQQKEELAKLRLENQKEMIKLRAEMEVLKLDLKALLEPKEIDKAKVYAQIDKLTNLRKGMMKKRIDFSLKRRAILTEEQWEKIKKSKRAFRFSRMRQGFLRGRHFFTRLRGRRLMERRLELLKE